MKKFTLNSLNKLIKKGLPVIIQDSYDDTSYTVKQFASLKNDDIEDTEEYGQTIKVAFVDEIPEYINVRDIVKIYLAEEIGLE